MSIVASAVISKVRRTLVDTEGVRWDDDELLGWLSDAQRSVAAAVPNASTRVTTINMVAGPRQTIPLDGFVLLDVYRNLTALGVTGNSIQEQDLELFRLQYPNWTTDTPTSAVIAFAKREDDPTGFYVYPPNDGTGSVEINYSVMPPTLTSLTDTLVVRDIFEPALFDYVMFRAHAKDSDYAAGEQVSTKYLNQFSAFVGTQVPAGE